MSKESDKTLKALERLVKYNITDPMESKAYKIALIWEDTIREEMPRVQHTKLSKTGDPRKCTLFKYCYKLAKETNGLIDDFHYKWYILAQIHVLKGICDSKGVHARIDCNSITGDKAWKRWQVWESKFKKKIVQPYNVEDLDIKAKKSKVLEDLDRTRRFIFSQFEVYPTIDQIQKLMVDHTLVRWVSLGRLSPFYALLSPLLKKCLDGRSMEDVFHFDLSVYRKSLTLEIEELFKEKFPEEFKDE